MLTLQETHNSYSTNRYDSQYLIKLRQALSEHFNAEELRTLCFDLDIDYEDLPGTGKIDKAREIVSYFKRRQTIPRLANAISQLRPAILENHYDHIHPYYHPYQPPSLLLLKTWTRFSQDILWILMIVMLGITSSLLILLL
jgi:hypothetical protein